MFWETDNDFSNANIPEMTQPQTEVSARTMYVVIVGDESTGIAALRALERYSKWFTEWR